MPIFKVRESSNYRGGGLKVVLSSGVSSLSGSVSAATIYASRAAASTPWSVSTSSMPSPSWLLVAWLVLQPMATWLPFQLGTGAALGQRLLCRHFGNVVVVNYYNQDRVWLA